MPAALAWPAERPAFSIVQIGAFTGESFNDPLCDFLRRQLSRESISPKTEAKVVLVEPVAEYYRQLCQNYSDLTGVHFENVAIAEEEGVRDFYQLTVDPRRYGYPPWLLQLGSIKPETPLIRPGRDVRGWQKFYLEHRVVKQVNCITLEQLFERYRLSEIDMLQVDTEGYDYIILRSAVLDRIRPRFINYERTLLEADELTACRELLRTRGYLLMDWGFDTFCIRMD